MAPTATNMPWSDGNGEAAAAEPLEAADDIADERNSAALTEEGAPEAPATSATSGGNDATPTLAATNVDAAEPLEVADDARAAWEREFARAAVALDARDASSQVGLAPLDPHGAMSLRMPSEYRKMDERDKEEQGRYDAEWEEAWEKERARGKEREAAWERE